MRPRSHVTPRLAATSQATSAPAFTANNQPASRESSTNEPSQASGPMSCVSCHQPSGGCSTCVQYRMSARSSSTTNSSHSPACRPTSAHGRISTAHARNRPYGSAPVWYTCPNTASSTPTRNAPAKSAAHPPIESICRRHASSTAATMPVSMSANFAMRCRSAQFQAKNAAMPATMRSAPAAARKRSNQRRQSFRSGRSCASPTARSYAASSSASAVASSCTLAGVAGVASSGIVVPSPMGGRILAQAARSRRARLSEAGRPYSATVPVQANDSQAESGYRSSASNSRVP